ncbi:MAG TPA: hypothetical protein DCZ94_00730 [Lentisphaeria bacterium]|nr:MAG: hypothetical protein A2X48_12295 [Lentisphaerae bacterium GWF2_49_21]HBC85456.1 hypothetical protein [Lentisphaeria bacterium]
MIKVNGERIPQRMIQQEFEFLKSRYSAQQGMPQPDESRLKNDAQENAIERMLLLQEARNRFPEVDAADVDKRFKEFIDRFGGRAKFQEKTGFKKKDEPRLKNDIGDHLKYERLIAELSSGAAVTEDECKEHYEKHKDDFMLPEMIRASHILMRPDASKNEMEIRCELMNLRERALKGEDFNAIAAQDSHCRDGNGDLGYFARGQMVQRFEDVTFSLDVNAVSEVFTTEFGMHIVKVFDKKPARAREFKEVRKEIESVLLDIRKNTLIGEFVDKLRGKASIEIEEDGAAAQETIQ